MHFRRFCYLKNFVAKKEDDNIDNSLDIYNAGLVQLNII